MSTAKDLFCLSIALFCFLAIWTTLILIWVLLGGYELPTLTYTFAFGVILLSFLVGAKLYHWLVIRNNTSNRQDLALLAAAIIAVLVLITLIVLLIRSDF